MINLIDEFTRECLAIRIDRRVRPTDVIDVLSDQFSCGECRSTYGPTTSYVGKKPPFKALDHGASERPDALKLVTQAGSAVKKWSLP